MTSKQQSEYRRACEIAARDGLIVKSVKVGDETVYVVVRPTNMSVHIVRREPVGLACDAACACSKFGRYCAHRAAVRVHLIAESEQQTPAAARIPASFDNPMPVAKPAFSIWASDR